MKNIVDKLTERKETISTMESCTGGYVVNSITNIEGASDVLKFSAVTYSNEHKIKMGVSEQTIKEYTVYSEEVAKEMAKAISDYSNSDYGIGVTGQINRHDKNNLKEDNNKIYICVYNRNLNEYIFKILEAIDDTRIENKKNICNNIKNILEEILN